MPETLDHNSAAIPDAEGDGASRALELRRAEHQALAFAELASMAQRLALGGSIGINDLQALGRLFIASRMAMGLNKAEAARMLDIQAPAMSRHEKQAFETVSIKRLSAMAKSFGLEIEINVRLGETPVNADDSEAAPSGRPNTTRNKEGGPDT